MALASTIIKRPLEDGWARFAQNARARARRAWTRNIGLRLVAAVANRSR